MLDNKSREMDAEIVRVVSSMKECEPESEEYRAMAENLKLLCESRGVKPASFIPEIFIGAATNILGILLILSYEHLHVITSKALGFVKK